MSETLCYDEDAALEHADKKRPVPNHRLGTISAATMETLAPWRARRRRHPRPRTMGRSYLTRFSSIFGR